MEIGIFAKTFSRPTLRQTLQAVAGTGLRTIQFNLALTGGPSMPDRIPNPVAEQIRREMTVSGLHMAAVSGTYNMAHPDSGVRADGSNRLAELIRRAAAIGTDVVTICTGSRDGDDMWRWHRENSSATAWRDMRTGLESALAVAEAHGVTLAFEPEHNNVVDSAATGRRLLDESGSDHLRVVIDPANLFPNGDLSQQADTLDEAFALLGDALILAHAKDITHAGEIVAAGHGNLDYERYLKLLDHHAPDVPLILHGLTEDQVPRCVAYLRTRTTAR